MKICVFYVYQMIINFPRFMIRQNSWRLGKSCCCSETWAAAAAAAFGSSPGEAAASFTLLLCSSSLHSHIICPYLCLQPAKYAFSCLQPAKFARYGGNTLIKRPFFSVDINVVLAGLCGGQRSVNEHRNGSRCSSSLVAATPVKPLMRPTLRGRQLSICFSWKSFLLVCRPWQSGATLAPS